MSDATANAWPLPLRTGAAAALGFAGLALLCESLASPTAHTPIHTADTGAMSLLAPLVWAIGAVAMLVVSLPAAALGAVLGRLAIAGLRLPVLAALTLPAVLLLGALYARLAAPTSALANAPLAMLCAGGAGAAALAVIWLHLTPKQGPR